MKKLILTLIILLLTVSTGYTYSIGGAYASLISCDYGQYGYEYGYLGTYKANNKFYTVFFGNSYCQY